MFASFAIIAAFVASANADLNTGPNIDTSKQWFIGDGGTGCSKRIHNVCNKWLFPDKSDGSGVQFAHGGPGSNAGSPERWTLEKDSNGNYKIYYKENPNKYYWSTYDSWGPNNYLELSRSDPGDTYQITEVSGQPGIYTLTAKKNCNKGEYPCNKKITWEKEYGAQNYWLKTDASEAATFRFCSYPCLDSILTPGYTEAN